MNRPEEHIMAFGGLAPLEGNNILRLVYADEAGISKHEPYVVVASVILHADNQLVAIERHIQKLIKKHIPNEYQDGFVFHASEIFNGGKIIKRNDPSWPDEKRFAIADDLAKIPSQFNLSIGMGFVDKKSFSEKYKALDNKYEENDEKKTHVAAFLTSVSFVEQWMRKNTQNEVCLMIVEDNHEVRSLIKNSQNEYQDQKLTAQLSEENRKLFPFKRVKHDPLFEQKKQGSPLQIADFCAYVFKRKLMNDEKYDRFFNPILKNLIAID